MKRIRLGTRRSLLAMAQSGWVARQVEALNPGVKVDLVGMDTQGDKLTHAPLAKLEGKEFFTAELDVALTRGDVDMTVHSLKDLSLTRPKELCCAAIPARADAHDVVVFSARSMERLEQGLPLRIGSSSPRRQQNIPPFLRQALPHLNGHTPEVDWREIRGNVNTRLGRIHLAANDERVLDGVVLALAGLTRLWRDDGARRDAGTLFQGIRWMVLPLRSCAAAPGQGALAVECRSSDTEVRDVIARLHHEATARQVERERVLLAEAGGGCHQKIGATCISHPELGELMFVSGADHRERDITHVEFARTAAPAAGQAWDGSKHPGERSVVQTPSLSHAKAIFVAHAHAWPSQARSQARVYASGASSWMALARQGVWVEGCADGLGFDALAPTLDEPVLGLPPRSDWTVLTHEGAEGAWRDLGFGQVQATYRVTHPAAAPADLPLARTMWWASPAQFDAWHQACHAEAVHACGPGRTAKHIRSRGKNPVVFPSVQEWRSWTALS